MWKKLSSKILFEHPRLLVEEDEVMLPSGEKIEYLRYGYRGNGVVIMCKNNDGKFLFLKEYAYIPNKNLIQLPMGLINKDESPELAANRELAEETGLIARSLKLIGTFLQSYRRSENTAYVYFGTNLEKHFKPKDKEEYMDSIWLTKTEIRDSIINGDIVDSDTLSALQIMYLLE